MTDIRLVVGLGNPGEKYKYTRHNVGFWFADQLALNRSFSIQSKFFCETADIFIGQHKFVLMKPQTYMNESGKSVGRFLNYYGIKSDQMLVVHDELDIPLGHVRFKYGGGCGGHRGLLSIAQNVGGQDFFRLRIGIGRPNHQSEVSNFVLSKPSIDQKSFINQALDFVTDHMNLLFDAKESFVRKIHSRVLL